MAKSDQMLMSAVVAGGAVAVIGALVVISRAKAQPLQGLRAAISFQPADVTSVTHAINARSINPIQRLRGWGSYGTPGFGAGTGSAIYWRRIS